MFTGLARWFLHNISYVPPTEMEAESLFQVQN